MPQMKTKQRRVSSMSKEQIKIRKQWLINPETQIQQSKKIKQKFQDEEEQDWKKYTGFVDKKNLEDMKNEEDDKE